QRCRQRGESHGLRPRPQGPGPPRGGQGPQLRPGHDGLRLLPSRRFAPVRTESSEEGGRTSPFLLHPAGVLCYLQERERRARVRLTPRPGSRPAVERRFAILPTLLTLGNGVCGFAAIAYASKVGPVPAPTDA